MVPPPSSPPAIGLNAAAEPARRDTPSRPNGRSQSNVRRRRARRLTAGQRRASVGYLLSVFFVFVFVFVLDVLRLDVLRQRPLRVPRVRVSALGGDALDARALPLAEHGGDERAFVAADTARPAAPPPARVAAAWIPNRAARPVVELGVRRTSPALASTAASPMRVDVAPSNDSATQSKTPVVRQSSSAALAPATAFAPPPGSTATPAERALGVQTDELPLEQTALAARLAVFIDVLPRGFQRGGLGLADHAHLVAGVHEAAHAARSRGARARRR